MLQAHSLLWNYLWIAPNLLLLLLAVILWRRGIRERLPVFWVFAILSSFGQLAVYAADVVPSVTPPTFWKAAWASLVVDGALKFILIGEIFEQVFGRYSSVARLGKSLIRALGAILILTATLAAAYAPQDGRFGLVSGAYMLDQTIYLVECGLLLFIFVFASYFHLSWPRPWFGITLGLSISACVHLASWAVMANGGLPDAKRVLFVFLNMATYHACVLIWFYYLLVPQSVSKNVVPSAPAPEGPSPLVEAAREEDLEVWNRELERLIHQ
jgi:hypothetical protein